MTMQKTDERRLIRGPALEVLAPRSRGLPFDEALRVAEQGRRVIASNSRMSKALVGSKEWRSISDVFACWTGTMTGYVEPGKKLGATIEYVDPETKQRWVFPVPEQFRGMKDVILVAEHPDYTIERDGRNLLVQTEAVDIVPNFPAARDRWYLADPKHDIPQGSEVGGNDVNARYLWRIDSRVGPAGRGYGCDWWGVGRYVGLDGWPSCGFGVAVEAPEQMKELVGRASTAVQELSATVLPGKLQPIRDLLEMLLPAEAKAKQGDKI